jgi:hypothetical protein
MRYKSEYKNTWQMIFRQDNWIRFVGVLIAIYGELADHSTIKNDYLGEVQSDVLYVVFGCILTIIGPDLRKIIIDRFGKKE